MKTRKLSLLICGLFCTLEAEELLCAGMPSWHAIMPFHGPVPYIPYLLSLCVGLRYILNADTMICDLHCSCVS